MFLQELHVSITGHWQRQTNSLKVDCAWFVSFNAQKAEVERIDDKFQKGENAHGQFDKSNCER